MSSQEGINQDQMVDPGIDSRLATANIKDTLARLAECSDFQKLVDGEDLGYLLRYPELQTLFAPANGSVAEAISTQDIETLVTGQMLRRAVQSYDLTPLSEVETNAGRKVAVTHSGDSVKLGNSQIVRADIPCTNGVIHIVDRPFQFEER